MDQTVDEHHLISARVEIAHIANCGLHSIRSIGLPICNLILTDVITTVDSVVPYVRSDGRFHRRQLDEAEVAHRRDAVTQLYEGWVVSFRIANHHCDAGSTHGVDQLFSLRHAVTQRLFYKHT